MLQVQYLGGKARTAKDIVAFINARVGEHQTYLEPFVGGCHIAPFITTDARIASDIHPDLIWFWRAIKQGWIPPSHVTEAEYNALKEQPEMPSALRGFVGFACSFGGKWFGGYARNGRGDNYALNGRNYALNGRNSALKVQPLLKGLEFHCCDYREWSDVKGAVIYCDPPYAGTTPYSMRFDHAAFWDWAERMSKENTVIVSEYRAPKEWKPTLEIATKTDLRTKTGKADARVESLFEFKTKRPFSKTPLFPI